MSAILQTTQLRGLGASNLESRPDLVQLAQDKARAQGIDLTCKEEFVWHPGGGYYNRTCKGPGTAYAISADIVAGFHAPDQWERLRGELQMLRAESQIQVQEFDPALNYQPPPGFTTPQTTYQATSTPTPAPQPAQTTQPVQTSTPSPTPYTPTIYPAWQPIPAPTQSAVPVGTQSTRLIREQAGGQTRVSTAVSAGEAAQEKKAPLWMWLLLGGGLLWVFSREGGSR